MLEAEGVDALIVHPRFVEDKFKRVPRHEILGELAAVLRIPLIANGDISGAAYLHERSALWRGVSGWLIGRHVAARPWLFAQWTNPGAAIDGADVMRRFCAYLREDFEPDKALRRLKVWIPYFARNYVFGHSLFAAVQNAPDWPTAQARLDAFWATHPEPCRYLSVDGI